MPLESLSQAARYYKVIPLLWEERIVAAYSESERLEALLEYPDFYQRVARVCWPESINWTPVKIKDLGIALIYVGNRGQSKRELAKLLGINPVEAQKILNSYYKIFYKVKEWLKKHAPSVAWGLVDSCYTRQFESAFERCTASLPQDWHYAGELSFRVPSYIYDVQVEKFLRHHFEREIEIRDKIIKLPVAII